MGRKLEQSAELAYSFYLLFNRHESVTYPVGASLSSGVEIEVGMLVNVTSRVWPEPTGYSETMRVSARAESISGNYVSYRMASFCRRYHQIDPCTVESKATRTQAV